MSSRPGRSGALAGLRPAWLAAFVLAHAVGALALLASMWSFVRSPFVSGEVLVAANADGYLPAVMRVENLVYIPPQLEGRSGFGQPEGSAIGIYYAQGTIDGSAESLSLGSAPPKDPREVLKKGDEIPVLFNRALPHPKYETGTGLRVQRFEPDFVARIRARFRQSLIAAYLPVTALVVLLLLLVAATRVVGPDRGRLRPLWLVPLVWLVPIGASMAFQAFAAVATRMMDAR